MTQVNSKKFLGGTVGIILLGIMLAPLSIQAFSFKDLAQQFRPGLNASSTPPILNGSPRANQGNVCQVMLQKLSQMQTQAQQRIGNLEQKKTERQTNLKERKDDRIAKQEEVRIKNDSHWQELFGKLEAKAQNDTQKQAILKFKQTVMTAIEAKRGAIDAANTAFKNKMQQLVDARKSAVDALAQTYQAEVNAAIEKAKIDCSATTADLKAVRETLATSMKTARERFAASRQQANKVKDDLAAAKDEHQAAIKKAQEEFRAAMEKAQEEFRQTMAALKPSPTSTE